MKDHGYISVQSDEVPRKDKLIQRPSIDAIIEKTAEEFSVSIESIMPPFLGGRIANKPRKIVMYIAKKIFDFKLKEIMLSFNLNHYGSVGKTIFIISNEIENSQELDKKINAIIKRLDP